MGHLSIGEAPRGTALSDDTAQNAASSCSGSDETAPPGRKEKPRSRPRAAHHEISIPLPAFGTAQQPRPIGNRHSGKSARAVNGIARNTENKAKRAAGRAADLQTQKLTFVRSDSAAP